MPKGSNNAEVSMLVSIAVEKHSRPLHRLVTRYVQDARDVEDIKQDTFLKLTQYANENVTRENLWACVKRIACGRIAEFLVRQAKDRACIEWTDDIEQLAESVMAANSGRFETGNPEERELRLETLENMHKAIMHMSPTLSAPLLLRACEGLSYQEIARRLGTTEVAARQDVRRARELLGPLV